MTTEEKSEMPFLDHLEELRWRIIKILIALVVASIGCYYFSDFLFEWLKYPLDRAVPDQKVDLNFLKVSEGFTTRLKLSFLAGVFISIPVTAYHVWKFIMPGLYAHEKKAVTPIVISSSILFLVGAATLADLTDDVTLLLQAIDHAADGRPVICDLRRDPGLIYSGMRDDCVQSCKLNRRQVEPGLLRVC